MSEYILTFGSAHKALKAESVLREAGAAFRLMPGPRGMDRACDLVIAVDGEGALSAAMEALERGGPAVRAVYRREGARYVAV